MSISSESAPRFPRLLSRPFKKDVLKKASVPSSGHLADILKDQSSWTPPPKVKTHKPRNAFVRALSKAIPCVSAKGNRKAFDDEDVLVVGGNSPSTHGGQGVGVNDYQVPFLRHPSIIAQVAPICPSNISQTSSSTSSLGQYQPAQSIHNSETFSQENITPPNAGATVNAPTTPLSNASPPTSPTPSSLSSIPQSILGDASPLAGDAEPVAVPGPNNTKSIFQLMDALTDVLENIQSVTEKDPAARDFFSCYPKVALLYDSIFGSVGASFKSRVEEYDETDDVGKFAPYNPEGINPSASQDTASVYSTSPSGSVEFVQDGANHANDSDDVPWIMLSLPTESDLGTREDTGLGIATQEERLVIPWMLSPIWEPTPEPVRKWRVREDIRRRSGAHLRKVASAPDLSYLASGFDSDSDFDEAETNVTVKALSNDREYMDSVASRVASESKRVGLGIVPDGFLPSPEALASRLRKIPVTLGSTEDNFTAGVFSSDASASLGSLSSNFVEVMSPELAPEEDDASAYASVPSSPLVGHLSPWTPQASSGPLRIIQGGEEEPPTTPKPATLSERRIRRRSEHYNRLSGVWNDKVTVKSDFSNFPTREESISRDRRSNGANVPGFLLPGVGKRGSMGYIKRPTGIRPLILPARLSLRESGVYTPSRFSVVSDMLKVADEQIVEDVDALPGDVPVADGVAAVDAPAVSPNDDLESTPAFALPHLQSTLQRLPNPTATSSHF